MLQTIRVTNCFAIANARQIGYGFLSMLTCDRKIALYRSNKRLCHDFTISSFEKSSSLKYQINETICHSTWLSFLTMLSPNPFETDCLYYCVEQFHSWLAVHVHSKYCCRVSHSQSLLENECVSQTSSLLGSFLRIFVETVKVVPLQISILPPYCSIFFGHRGRLR